MSDYPDYLAERDYYDSILGPRVKRYVGDKPKVEHTRSNPRARSEGYPWLDGIDYDPRFDEDLEDQED